MEYLNIVIWIIVGIVIGALGTWLISVKQFNRTKLKQELKDTQAQLSQYRQDVSNHLETTNQLMTQLQDNYARIARHIADSRMQLVERPTESLHQIDEKRRVYSSTEQQPLDYSGHASGLIRERRNTTTDE